MMTRVWCAWALAASALSCSSGGDNADTSMGGAPSAGTSGAATTTAGMTSSGGVASTAGAPSGGQPSSGGGGSGGVSSVAGSSTGGDSAGTSSTGGVSQVDPALEKFSFFLTSLASIRIVSKNEEGFGGDLTFGETGDGAGLRGADKICKAIAELGMPGAGAKDWRAFLSATKGPDGKPVHAKSRIGNGPWYDAAGRLVAMTLADLIGSNRPKGADPAIRDDLPNEFGIPNHSADAPGCTGNACPDNHQVLTGTNCVGELYTGGGSGFGNNEVTADCTGVVPAQNEPDPEYTCNDWTSKEPAGKPWCGHSWPRQGSGLSWMSAARDGGCAPCVKIVEMGGVSGMCVGSAGGYGGFYCFEYKP